MPSETTIRIIESIRAVPPGKVASYGLIAVISGCAGGAAGARQVVRILASMSRSQGLPWWRIVRKDGSIALGPGEGADLQRSLLESEGVEVSEFGKIDMERFGFDA